MSSIQVYVKRGSEQPPVHAGEVAAAPGEFEFAAGHGFIRGAAMIELRQLLELYCGGVMEGDFRAVYDGATLDGCHITKTGEQFEFTYRDQP
ncbi:MAG TPA: hypothetical protein VFF06_36400 [Polyangia bacterium]|nr:hypothetical protein [Polyangia bacterium]